MTQLTHKIYLKLQIEILCTFKPSIALKYIAIESLNLYLIFNTCLGLIHPAIIKTSCNTIHKLYFANLSNKLFLYFKAFNSLGSFCIQYLYPYLALLHISWFYTSCCIDNVMLYQILKYVIQFINCFCKLFQYFKHSLA